MTLSEMSRSGVDVRTIGDISRRHGLSLRTLRFYEQIGLLMPIRNGVHRLYTARDEVKLQLIATGKRLGFSLREIGALIADHMRERDTEASELFDMLDLDTIETRISVLERQRADLEVALSELKASASQSVDQEAATVCTAGRRRFGT